MTSFSDLGLAGPILKALADEGHATPTPIQAKAIPAVLAGRDLLGIAQTGTGKTAAFALPILDRLAAAGNRAGPKSCRVLVLAPTRELANQIRERFQAYGRHLALRTEIAIGGVGIGAQIRALSAGTDILIATPGRLIDLMGSGAVRLDRVEVLVLDEADRMLDMGFIQPIRKIAAKLPKVRQSLFFSATMPTAIAGLAADLLRDPVSVAVTPAATTVDRVDQHVVFVAPGGKLPALVSVLSGPAVQRALVFARTKRGADRIVRGLAGGGINAEAIHGNKSQPQRERVLGNFGAGKTRVLVATDIAARGIDVAGITHVVNYDLPNEPESYVHRIGRTARAGAAGIAISLCEGEERDYLRAIEKLIRQTIPVMAGSAEPPHRHEARAEARPQARQQRPQRSHPAKAVTRGRGNHESRPRSPEAGIAGVAFMSRAHGDRPAFGAGAGAVAAASDGQKRGKGGASRFRKHGERAAARRDQPRRSS